MRLTSTRNRRGIDRAKRIWAELDYAQRRSMELRTGVPMGAAERRARIGRNFDELSRLRAA
jgi:hypothetical protein